MTTRKFPYASPLPSDVHRSSFLSGKPDAAPSALLPRGVKVSIKGGLYLLPRSLEVRLFTREQSPRDFNLENDLTEREGEKIKEGNFSQATTLLSFQFL